MKRTCPDMLLVIQNVSRQPDPGCDFSLLNNVFSLDGRGSRFYLKCGMRRFTFGRLSIPLRGGFVALRLLRANRSRHDERNYNPALHQEPWCNFHAPRAFSEFYHSRKRQRDCTTQQRVCVGSPSFSRRFCWRERQTQSSAIPIAGSMSTRLTASEAGRASEREPVLPKGAGV